MHKIWPLIGLLLAGTLLAALSHSQPTTGAGETAVYLPIISKNFPPPDHPYLLTTIPLPANTHPHGIALDLDRRRAFVGGHLSNKLLVLDLQTRAVVAAIPLPGADGPNGVAYHAATDRVYVANRNSGNVSVVDPTAGQWLQNIGVGALPNGVAVQDDLIYVANWGDDTVSVIDATTQTVSHSFASGAQPALMADSDPRGFVYLAAYGTNHVHYLRDGAIYNNRPSVSAPYGIAFDPITFRLYAASRGNHQKLTLVDVNSNHLAGSIPVGGEVFTVGANPRTGHIFAVMGDRVQVSDRRDHALLSTIPIGAGAEESIAVDAASGLVYVTAGAADELAVIQDTAVFDIVYVTWVQNVSHLVIVDDTGEHSHVLAGPDEAFVTPEWHPNGKQLAFSRYHYARQEYDVWVVEAGGGNLINLTAGDDGTQDEYPVWSPDGMQLAWVRDKQLWVMDEGGGNKRPLTPTDMQVEKPAWSPDGNLLVVSGRTPSMTDNDLFAVAINDGSLTNLTNHAGYDGQPAWSPDGTAVAFQTNREGDSEIYKLAMSNFPGTVTAVPLTDNGDTDHAPAWSHDGAHIAFISYQCETAVNGPCVYLMNADGSEQRALTGATTFLTPLRWSPNDQWLLTHTLSGADPGQIVKTNVQTGEIVTLTTGVSQAMWPTWRPDTWR